MSDIVKLYNPANAAALTSEQLEGLQKLTSPEIKELATAYPNMTMQRAYLLIRDSSKSIEKQLPSLSTFENLWNLREKNGLRQYVAYAFKGAYKQKTITPARAKNQEVLDLTDTQLMNLPGFKTAKTNNKPETVIPPQEVKVNRVKKIAKPKTKK